MHALCDLCAVEIPFSGCMLTIGCRPIVLRKSEQHNAFLTLAVHHSETATNIVSMISCSFTTLKSIDSGGSGSRSDPRDDKSIMDRRRIRC